MNEEKAEYRNKQRSSFWWATLLWCLLLALAYGGVDIVEKGKALNEMTSYPVWGYVLWGLILVALWFLVVGPVIHFCNLRYVGEESLRRQVLRASNALSAYRHEPEESELRQIADEFAAAPRDFTSIEGKHGWQELLARFREAVHGRARDTIIGYCKAAGVGMLFGFNGLLDGFVLLAIQLRLALELARVFGYKPTSLFNGGFFAWVVANSLVVALTSGLVDALSASTVETMLGSASGQEASSVASGLEWVLSVLMQALIAGILTCISGRLFLWRLEHEGRETALKSLLKLREEGRREYAAKLLGASAALGLMEEDAKTPASPLTGRLLQLFGRRLENKPTPAALESPSAESEAAAPPPSLGVAAAAEPTRVPTVPALAEEPEPEPLDPVPAPKPEEKSAAAQEGPGRASASGSCQ